MKLLKKYRHHSNVTACALKFMITNCRSGLACPPYGTVLHKPNRYAPQDYGLINLWMNV